MIVRRHMMRHMKCGLEKKKIKAGFHNRDLKT